MASQSPLYVCAYFDEDSSISVLSRKKCRTEEGVEDLTPGLEIKVNWPKNRKPQWWKGVVIKTGKAWIVELEDVLA